MSQPPYSDTPSLQPEEPVRLTLHTPGQRLDLAIVEHLPHLSRSAVQRLIKEGRVLVNAAPAKASYRVEGGETVTVALPPPIEQSLIAEDIPLTVLYEDADLVAIDKPAGMVVHPAAGHHSGTLVNAALARWPDLLTVGGQDRVGIVHRLDKGTSGVIVLARTDAALADLQAQFKQRTVQKRYLALVEGIPDSSEGIINAPLGRDPKRRKRIAVVTGGRASVTRYTMLEAFDEHALLEVHPQTGRTHQIRVHFAWLGHPVVGDRVYGYRKQRFRIKRLWLHAASLTISSPATGQPLIFEAPLPSALEHTLTLLRRERH